MNIDDLAAECEIAHLLSGKPVLTANELESLKRSAGAMADYCSPKVEKEMKQRELRKPLPRLDKLPLTHLRILKNLNELGEHSGITCNKNQISARVAQLIKLGLMAHSGSKAYITEAGRAAAEMAVKK